MGVYSCHMLIHGRSFMAIGPCYKAYCRLGRRMVNLLAVLVAQRTETFTRSHPYRQCRDGVRRVSAEQAGFACTKREAKREELGEWHRGGLYSSEGGSDFLGCFVLRTKCFRSVV